MPFARDIEPMSSTPSRALDHDDFGPQRSKVMKVIESTSSEWDAGGKPGVGVPRSALGIRRYRRHRHDARLDGIALEAVARGAIAPVDDGETSNLDSMVESRPVRNTREREA